MTYAPKPFVREATPENLSAYLQEEFQAISRELTETQVLELRGINAAPSKPREGMLAHADGTNWNPGNGKGLYVYQAGAWVGPLENPAAAPDLTPYMQKASNLSDVANTTTSRSNLGLGTAATLDVGTTANRILQLDGSAKIPAVDGSQLTNLPAQTGRLVAGTALVLNPYTTSALTTQAHGLGVEPALITAIFECLTANLGYSVGEKIIAPVGQANYFVMSFDSTNVNLIRTTTPSFIDKAGFTFGAIAVSSWKLTLTPYKLTT